MWPFLLYRKIFTDRNSSCILSREKVFLCELYQSKHREISSFVSFKFHSWLSNSLCSILNMFNHILSGDSFFNADKITLQMSERCFIITHETLVVESGFFASLLSECWNNAAENDSYFVDANVNLFEHILRYLRREVFLFFYEKSKEHNYALYLALLEKTKYFQIRQLEEWLKKKQYFYALRIMYFATESEKIEGLNISRNTDIELKYYSEWSTKKVYVCSRGIYVHKKKSNACEKDCRRAQDDADDIYEKKFVLRMLMMKKKTIFDMQDCLIRQWWPWVWWFGYSTSNLRHKIEPINSDDANGFRNW